ncbi:MAG: hypothetical protein AAB675_04555 [Patescibacteria group bacterium]
MDDNNQGTTNPNPAPPPADQGGMQAPAGDMGGDTAQTPVAPVTPAPEGTTEGGDTGSTGGDATGGGAVGGDTGAGTPGM